ncbi:ATP-binding protein [Tenacibaculum sp. Mcav3-52]|uniref:AAA family ATPase n=1 Tax=Tenacibaculum sp. Mcav3-52 TaxID=2917762 RepID=UPI001EF2FEB4|nr:AAA family ATPase [Tenacibaculum sp. Mcav3-52]MCG7501716.1 ATP-binding protein [Tenacibaculum sp. Mcav3-52]
MSLKICYIWVREFRNFTNTGFNFSSSEKFHYNNEKGRLTIEKIKELPSNFFGESITEVTALIGKNGSGKSNALELVCKLLKGGKTSITEDFLIITKENGQFVGYRSKKEGWMLEFDFPLQLREYDKNIDPLKIVYFSNVFDEKENNFAPDIADTSYNSRYKTSMFRFNRKEPSDFQKQLYFINSPYFKNLNIEIPEGIKITPKIWNTNNSSLMSGMSDFVDFDLTKFSKFIRQRLKEISKYNKLYYYVVYTFYLDSIKHLMRYNYRTSQSLSKNIGEHNTILNNYENLKTEEIFEELVFWLKSTISSVNNFIDVNYFKEVKLLEPKLDFIFQLREERKEMVLDLSNEGARNRYSESFIFNYKYGIPDIIIENIKLLEDSSFVVNWLGISSGHKAYLNIFSLIYYELRKVKRENLLLCIDEGDLYLHPQWQIEFFDRLVTVLPQIFKGNIQIILTSHSPFLLSDLPKQNITVVSPREEEQTLNGNELDTETFAGNIYSLYEEPFFLGNQRISLFAKKKIDQIFEELESKDSSTLEYDEESLKRRVELIGDEVIKFHLMKKLHND